jgi:hypothetical protein
MKDLKTLIAHLQAIQEDMGNLQSVMESSDSGKGGLWYSEPILNLVKLVDDGDGVPYAYDVASIQNVLAAVKSFSHENIRSLWLAMYDVSKGAKAAESLEAFTLRLERAHQQRVALLLKYEAAPYVVLISS